MTTVRYHPDELVDVLIAWCAEHITTHSANVLAVGLALVHGYNEHQIRQARVLDAPRLLLAVPCSRRAGGGPPQETVELDLARTSSWLEQAARAHLAHHRDPSAGKLLFPPRSRVERPLGPQAICKLVAEAGKLATGCRITPASLNQTRTARLLELDLPLPLFTTGHARSWATRLLQATTQPRPSRPA